MPIPESFAHHFVDCDAERLDPHKHAFVVLGSLMSRTEEIIRRWLHQTYEPEVLLAWLNDNGVRHLGPIELDYWCRNLGVAELTRAKWIAAAHLRMGIARQVR
jgi:hypothetical protein